MAVRACASGWRAMSVTKVRWSREVLKRLREHETPSYKVRGAVSDQRTVTRDGRDVLRYGIPYKIIGGRDFMTEKKLKIFSRT